MSERAPISFPVEATQIMLFARAIGDDQTAAFVDIAHPEVMVAPPTFVEVLQHFIPDYHARPKPGEPWFGSGATPTGVSARRGTTTMHAEQHFEYHRPITPGDTLVATSRRGKVWEKSGRSGGMHFSELITEFRDDRGRLVVTSIQVEVVVTPLVQSDKVDD